jgi:hypothetical protein
MGRRPPASNRYANHMPSAVFGHNAQIINSLRRKHFWSPICHRPVNGILPFAFGKQNGAGLNPRRESRELSRRGELFCSFVRLNNREQSYHGDDHRNNRPRGD